MSEAHHLLRPGPSRARGRRAEPLSRDGGLPRMGPTKASCSGGWLSKGGHPTDRLMFNSQPTEKAQAAVPVTGAAVSSAAYRPIGVRFPPIADVRNALMVQLALGVSG